MVSSGHPLLARLSWLWHRLSCASAVGLVWWLVVCYETWLTMAIITLVRVGKSRIAEPQKVKAARGSLIRRRLELDR